MRDIKGPEDVKPLSAYIQTDESGGCEPRQVVPIEEVGQIIALAMDAEHAALEATYIRRDEYTDDERTKLYEDAAAWRSLSANLNPQNTTEAITHDS